MKFILIVHHLENLLYKNLLYKYPREGILPLPRKIYHIKNFFEKSMRRNHTPPMGKFIISNTFKVKS